MFSVIVGNAFKQPQDTDEEHDDGEGDACGKDQLPRHQISSPPIGLISWWKALPRDGATMNEV